MATVRLPLAKSATGEFGIEYNDANGRASTVYCTDPHGVSGRVVLDNGQIVAQALTDGQTMNVPGNRVQVTFDVDGYTLIGVISLSFEFGG